MWEIKKQRKLMLEENKLLQEEKKVCTFEPKHFTKKERHNMSANRFYQMNLDHAEERKKQTASKCAKDIKQKIDSVKSQSLDLLNF